VIPASERQRIVDNIGLPARAYNLAFSDGTTIGPNDGVILVRAQRRTRADGRLCAEAPPGAPERFPEETFYFQAADIVTQILNFGVPSQIDVRTVGYDRANNLAIAKQLRDRIAAIPGVADAHVQQETNAPSFYVNIDRVRAAQLGLTANAVASNINVSLSSSEQVSPNFWTDPASGIPYYIAVQTPEPRLASLNSLENTPVSTALAPAGDPIPGFSATWQRSRAPASRPTATSPTSSRSTTSMPTSRIPTSAVSPTPSAKSSPNSSRSSSPATSSRSRGRSRA
jgi:hypothetical protein